MWKDPGIPGTRRSDSLMVQLTRADVVPADPTGSVRSDESKAIAGLLHLVPANSARPTRCPTAMLSPTDEATDPARAATWAAD